MGSRRAVLVSGVALGIACGDGSVRDGSSTTTTTTTDGGTHDDADDLGSSFGPDVSVRGDGPSVLAYPPAVARGGLLYLVSDEAMPQLDVAIGGRPLSLEHVLQTDLPAGLLRLPSDLAAGEHVLTVGWRDGTADGVTEGDVAVVDGVFEDVATEAGVGVVHDAGGSPQDCAFSHTGLAFGDYDDDGAPDLFVGNVGSGGQLHRNRGDVDGDGVPDFADVTADVGLEGVDAVAMAEFIDIEGDGDLDLFVGRRGTNRLFENRLVPDGETRFADVTAAVGLGVESQRTMGVAFGDYDGDDDLDLYVVNHAFCFPQMGSEVRAEDHLYRNDGGAFVERSAFMGGSVMHSVGFSASWVDTDRDGDQDLVVINDDVGGTIGTPNAHWRNDGPGEVPGQWVFTDVSERSGVALPGVNGMGLALGDVDGDGYVDLAFSNIGPNRLLMNAGDGTFIDVSAPSGIERASMPWERRSVTWATHLFDFDNDGDLDLYFSGGRIKGPGLIVDALFENGGDGRFEEITWSSGVADPASAKAAAVVDLESDGRWDMATTAWGDTFRLYHNRSVAARDNHYLDVELEGRGGNRAAIGAIVELATADRTHTCFHTNRPSLGAGGQVHCHFGLGTRTELDSLRITWPDGTVENLDPPAVDRRARYVHPDF